MHLTKQEAEEDVPHEYTNSSTAKGQPTVEGNSACVALS